jgi:hypothetical protein
MTTSRIAGGNGNGVAFIVSAGVVYEIIAACCSSPQTTEINAGTRAPTLMKWVHLGIVQSAFFIGIAAAIDPKRRAPILAGGITAGALLYGQYVHARNAGLSSSEPATEDVLHFNQQSDGGY